MIALVLLLAPAVVSSLVLAGHFVRRGQSLPGLFCLALVSLPFVRRPWARRVWQAFLGIGSLAWLAMMSSFVRTRMRAGGAWHRPALDLFAVAAFTLVAALLLEHPKIYAYFAGGEDKPGH